MDNMFTGIDLSPKKKKTILQVFFNVAASTFIGICVYGLLVYGENPKKISPVLSVCLGCVAAVCVVLIYFLGTALDKLEAELARESKEKG